MTSFQMRLNKLEQQAEAERHASIVAWVDWVEANTPPDEHSAYWRAVYAKREDGPPGPDWGEPQPNDLEIAQAVELRAPLEMINRLRVAWGQPPLTEAERAGLFAGNGETKANGTAG